jgi:membrane-associated phospholipid phosphatase
MKHRFAISLLFSLLLALPQNLLCQTPADTLPSISNNLHFYGASEQSLRRKKILLSYTPPLVLVTYGIIAVGPNKYIYDRFSAKQDVQKAFPGFHSSIDNYLQFAPAAGVFGLSLCGVKGKHSLKEQIILYAGSMLVSEGIATGLKYTSHMHRPDNSDYYSFPSGHTTSAFTGAELINQEYSSSSFLYSVLGYGAATATGFMRMMNNKHWLSDVMVGAGIGMISTKVVYAVYPYLKKRICRTKENEPSSMM